MKLVTRETLKWPYTAFEKIAYREVWQDFWYEPIQFLKPSFESDWLWIIAFLIASIFYAVSLRKNARHDFSEWYTKTILQNRQQTQFGQGGSARFSGLLEEWGLVYRKLKEDKKGKKQYPLFMGRSLHNPFINIGLVDSRHMLTIAGSRTGKGTSAIVPNLLKWEGSVLVIDPKGTNAAVTARARKEMGQQVFIVDPFNVVDYKVKELVMQPGQSTHSFNPLKMLVDTGSAPEGKNDIREQINAITEALVVSTSQDTHWDDGAKTVIAGLIGYLITDPQYKNNPDLTQIRDLLAKTGDDWLELVTRLRLNTEAGGLPRDAGSRLQRGGDTKENSKYSFECR